MCGATSGNAAEANATAELEKQALCVLRAYLAQEWAACCFDASA